MPMAELTRRPSASFSVLVTGADGFIFDALLLCESCRCQARSVGNMFCQPPSDFCHYWLCCHHYLRSFIFLIYGGDRKEIQFEWVGTTLGQCKKELDVNYLILSVITNSCKLRYCRLKTLWSFTWSAACSFLFYLLPFLLWKIKGFKW